MEKKQNNTLDVPGLRYDPEMDKYDNVVLFPEKLARANENIKNSNLIEFLNTLKANEKAETNK